MTKRSEIEKRNNFKYNNKLISWSNDVYSK